MSIQEERAMRAVSNPHSSPWPRAAGLLFTGLAIALVDRLAPVERTLGPGARLVYLHGAWVWAALAVFAAAAAAGGLALIARRGGLHAWSLALGRTGMLFWLASLPLSLLVMRMNWGGFFFDEPRWRIPFAFAIAGTLLQAALALFALPALSSAANLVFGAALIVALRDAANIMHPDSPIFQSDAAVIQAYFGIVLFLSLAGAAQVALWLRDRSRP